ncbi:hypothetical protein [Rufibacter roseus]|uniref:Uncharacterized protein n=1 Tax=Rufibacter roseus TaxID=1567108 RepID=A0ABW2DK42_9BACT|nr:hypothetical protein [Rufibacter roseus]
MNQEVSVDQAINRGQRMINWPAVVIMFGTIGGCVYLAVHQKLSFWFVPLSFVLGLALAWLYWSFMITKWRIWAFENVRNVHELKKKAIKEKLIWPDESAYSKTEIRTAADKERLLRLQEKFAQEDVFHEDFSILNETIIYFSKWKSIVEVLFMVISLVVGIYLIIDENYWVGGALAGIGVYFSFTGIKKAGNKSPQITLSEKGIETASSEFYSWRAIRNEDVVREGYGKDTKYYLVYEHPEGAEKIPIADFDINHRELENLLVQYRGRYKRNMHFYS